VQGRLQPDRFSGGLRMNVSMAWDLTAARARFGRWLSVEVAGDAGVEVGPEVGSEVGSGVRSEVRNLVRNEVREEAGAGLGRGPRPTGHGLNAASVADLLRLWPAQREEDEHGERVRGLPVRLRLQRRDATAEIDLGEQARFWPCDEALGRWRSLAHRGSATIVYE